MLLAEVAAGKHTPTAFACPKQYYSLLKQKETASQKTRKFSDQFFFKKKFNRAQPKYGKWTLQIKSKMYGNEKIETCISRISSYVESKESRRPAKPRRFESVQKLKSV